MPLHYNSTISKNAYQSPYFFFLCIHHLTPFIFDVNHLQNFSFSFFFSFFYSVKFKHLFDYNIYSPPSFPESPYLSLFPRSRARLILLTQKTKRGLSWEENRSTNQRAPRYKSSKAWEWACAFLKKKRKKENIITFGSYVGAHLSQPQAVIWLSVVLMLLSRWPCLLLARLSIKNRLWESWTHTTLNCNRSKIRVFHNADAHSKKTKTFLLYPSKHAYSS